MKIRILILCVLISCGLFLFYSFVPTARHRSGIESENVEPLSSSQIKKSLTTDSTIQAQREIASPNSDDIQLRDELRQIFTQTPVGKTLSLDNITRLMTLVPRLKSVGMFWDTIGAVPAEQLSHFRGIILTELKSLDYRNGSYVNPQFRTAYSVSYWLHDSAVATIALEQLQNQNAFVYPRESQVKGWPTANDTEYLLRGNQGILATTVVEFGNKDTMQAYRKMLTSTSSDSQRVLIWALGRSARLEDFELLMSLREEVHSPEIIETLIRALNRIHRSMEIVARSPESTSIENRPEIPNELLEISESCRKRLSELGLTVEPSFED